MLIESQLPSIHPIRKFLLIFVELENQSNDEHPLFPRVRMLQPRLHLHHARVNPVSAQRNHVLETIPHNPAYRHGYRLDHEEAKQLSVIFENTSREVWSRRFLML